MDAGGGQLQVGEVLVDLPEAFELEAVVDLLVELVEVVDQPALPALPAAVVVRDVSVAHLEVADAEPALREHLHSLDALHQLDQVTRLQVVVEGGSDGGPLGSG